MRLDRVLPKILHYVRRCELLDSGKFIIHCQFEDQSKLLGESKVLYVDKTFKRTSCNELEFNSYDKATGRITTLARIYTDLEDRQAYFQAFRSLFEVAERDLGRPIQFDHLMSHPNTQYRDSKPSLYAVLVDMHGGQALGLMDYLQSRYPLATAQDHLSGLVKVCRVHYQRAIIGERQSLKRKGVPAGK
jgi:hypothetical protein